MKAFAAVVLALATGLVAPAAANAQLRLVDSEDLSLELGAFASTFNAYSVTGYETHGLAAETTGSSAALARLEWRGQVGERVSAELQNRFFWSTTTAPGVGARQVGLGSTTPPRRTVDLRSEFIDESGIHFEHDVDRAAVTVFTPVADITAGRQAITWGNSALFTVADFWTQFSPFELDTSQKRGVDALRALSYPADGVELDVVVVDRGSLDNLSGGARLGWTLGPLDYYGALAKSYQTIWGVMGATGEFDHIRGRGEITLPLSLDSGDLELPRLTLGADWFGSELQVMLEYHVNGPGADAASDYLGQLTSPAVARGERYFVGRHYAGALVSWLLADGDLALAAAGIVNLLDPSGLITPSVTYQIAQNASVSLGAYLGVGEAPVFAPPNADGTPALAPPELNSEFGLYGRSAFLQLSGFF